MDYQYFEDYAPGQSFTSEPITVSEEQIIEFAQKYDSQLMHTNPEAAKTITGGLIASGWHTASLTMNRLVTSGHFNPAPGALGLGFESLKWHRPVRPGDSLRLKVEVLEVRESQSKPTHGVVTNKFTTLNQRDEIVQEMKSSVIVAKQKT